MISNENYNQLEKLRKLFTKMSEENNSPEFFKGVDIGITTAYDIAGVETEEAAKAAKENAAKKAIEEAKAELAAEAAEAAADVKTETTEVEENTSDNVEITEENPESDEKTVASVEEKKEPDFSDLMHTFVVSVSVPRSEGPDTLYILGAANEEEARDAIYDSLYTYKNIDKNTFKVKSIYEMYANAVDEGDDFTSTETPIILLR